MKYSEIPFPPVLVDPFLSRLNPSLFRADYNKFMLHNMALTVCHY